MIRAILFAAVFLALVGPLTAGAAAVLTGEIAIGGAAPSPLRERALKQQSGSADQSWGEGAHQ